MSLDPVILGDPHVFAHNEERGAINDLAVEVGNVLPQAKVAASTAKAAASDAQNSALAAESDADDVAHVLSRVNSAGLVPLQSDPDVLVVDENAILLDLQLKNLFENDESDSSKAGNAAFSVQSGYKVSLLGASITYLNGNSSEQANPGVGNPVGWGDSGITTWANILLNQPMEMVANASHGGYTSEQILGLLPKALAPRPNYVIGHDWWINDIAFGVSLAQSKANIEAIIRGCNEAGATAILTDYVPVNAYTTRAMVEQNYRMLDWLRAMQNPGFLFVPISDVISNPATGVPAAWATYDGTHPSVRGARALGEQFANRIGHLFRGSNARHPVATSYYAGSGVMGNPWELIANPLFAGTSTPVAGLWSLTGSGSPVGSRVVCDDLPELSWQRITFGAAGTAILVPGILTGGTLAYSGPAGGLTLTPGQSKTRFQFEFRIPSVSDPAKWACVTGYSYNVPNSRVVYALQNNNVNGESQGYAPDDDQIYMVQSPVDVLPVGSDAVAAAIVLYGEAGTVIDVRRASLSVIE